MKPGSPQRGAVAWSVSDLAKAIGLPRSSIYDAIRRGDGPRTHRLGRRYVILADDLAEWLRSLPLVGEQPSHNESAAIARYPAVHAQRSTQPLITEKGK